MAAMIDWLRHWLLGCRPFERRAEQFRTGGIWLLRCARCKHERLEL